MCFGLFAFDFVVLLFCFSVDVLGLVLVGVVWVGFCIVRVVGFWFWVLFDVEFGCLICVVFCCVDLSCG